VPQTVEAIEKAIYAKVVELARTLGKDARALKPDQVIPQTGWLDSAGLMELMLWVESTYDLEIPQEDFTLDNFGTIQAIAGYLQKAGKA
jgi:D-alanine--poly(phosphoribitol) ligase subunit 2